MFQVGDVVVCVDASPRFTDFLHIRTCLQLRAGKMYRVAGLARFDGGVLIDGIRAECEYAGFGWIANRFRKVTAADEQFTASIRACRDAHSPAPVA